MKKWLQDVCKGLLATSFGGVALTKEDKLEILIHGLLSELESQGYDVNSAKLQLTLLWVGEDYVTLEGSGSKWEVRVGKYQGREEDTNAILSSKVSP